MFLQWHDGSASTPAAIRGMLKWVSATRNDDEGFPLETHAVVYTYFDELTSASPHVGTNGDLVQVERIEVIGEPGAASLESFWSRFTQYRYHDGFQPGTGDERLTVNGAEHQLKAVFLPEQIEYFAQQWNTNLGTKHAPGAALAEGAVQLLTMDDDTALPFEASLMTLDVAAKVVGYHMSGADEGKVERQYVQSACGCGGATQGLKLGYEYFLHPTDRYTTKVTEYIFDGTDFSTIHRTRYYDMEPQLATTSVPYLVNRAVVELACPHFLYQCL